MNNAVAWRRFIDQIAKSSSIGFIIGALGLLFGLLGFLVGIWSLWMYVNELKGPLLVYHVDPVRTVLFRNGQLSGLSLNYRGNEVKSDVTTVQVEIWNDGKEAITPKQIVKPLKIVTKPEAVILDASIRDYSRKDISFALEPRTIATTQPITWQILQQNDGAIVQLTFAGGITTSVEIQGELENEKEIPQAPVGGGVKSQKKQVASDISRPRVDYQPGVIIAGFTLLLFALGLILKKPIPDNAVMTRFDRLISQVLSGYAAFIIVFTLIIVTMLWIFFMFKS